MNPGGHDCKKEEQIFRSFSSQTNETNEVDQNTLISKEIHLSLLGNKKTKTKKKLPLENRGKGRSLVMCQNGQWSEQ